MESGPFFDRQTCIEHALFIKRLANDLKAERQPLPVQPRWH